MDPQGDPLQFDRAEYQPGQAAPSACAVCNKPIESWYYDVNGKLACPDCAQSVQAATSAKGGGFLRFLQALGLGLVAALVGWAIYYAIAALTGYEFGLIAILVGLMIGFAVKFGSGGRGGWLYQLLAVLLTYLAVAMTNWPATSRAVQASFDSTASEMELAAAEDGEELDGEAAAEAEDAAAEEPPAGPVSFLAILLGFVFALISPFFSGIMGIIIMGIGLWEAWKVNIRAVVSIAGPFQLGGAPAAVPGPFGT